MNLLAAVSFQDIFPSFESQIQNLHELLIPVAAVLMITGLLSALRYAYTPRSMMRALMVTILITASVAFWADWMTLAQSGLDSIVDEMDASPSNAASRYIELIIAKNGADENSFSLRNLRLSILSDVLVTGFLNLIGIIASFLIWVAYIIQKFFLGFSYAFAPLFLSMLALRSTSSIGVRFIMATVGILVWPLGWAAASIGTSNLIDVFTRQELAAFGPLYSHQSTLGAGIIGLWVIVTTLISPIIIQKVISSGANIGAALTSGALTGTADAGKAGVGAAATIAATGATGGVAALGGMAAIGSSATGSTMRGGGGGFSGHSLQSLAPKLAQSSSAGGSSLPSQFSSGISASSLSTGAIAPETSALSMADLTRDRSAAEARQQAQPSLLQSS